MAEIRPQFLKEPKSTYWVTDKINWFLLKFCLSGYTEREKKYVVPKNIKFYFIFMMTFTTVYTLVSVLCRFYFSYWGDTWNIRAYTECLITILSTTFIIALFFKNYNMDLEIVKLYYNYYEIIDNFLMITTEEYEKEKKKLNILFLAHIFANSLKVIIEPVVFCKAIGFIEYFPFYNNSFTSSLHYINMVHVLIKILIFESRFSKFKDLVECNSYRSIFVVSSNTNKDISHSASALSKCYQVFCKLNNIINKEHGWQLFLDCAYTLICITRYIFRMVSNDFIGPKMIAITCTAISEVIINGGVTVYAVILAEKIIAVRTRLLLHIEDTLANESLDSQERISLKDFLGQIYRQPLYFSGFNIFCLNFKLLQTMCTVSFSYIVILTQLKSK